MEAEGSLPFSIAGFLNSGHDLVFHREMNVSERGPISVLRLKDGTQHLGWVKVNVKLSL
jgi:hypothetical protein